MKTYTGARTIDGIEVLVDGAPLEAQLDLKNFTTLGFEWTYEGASPRQLALAILADHLGDDQRALALTEAFMAGVVAHFDNDWQMTSQDIDAAIANITRR